MKPAEHAGSATDPGGTVQVEVDCGPAEVLTLVDEVAATWGADWRAGGTSGGRLELPVIAGLRRGWVAGEVTIERRGTGSVVRFRPQESAYRVDRAAFVTLLVAAAGVLAVLVAPFVPRLWPLVPVGILLGLGAWLFIIARLRNSGPDELFADLANAARGSDPGLPGEDATENGE